MTRPRTSRRGRTLPPAAAGCLLALLNGACGHPGPRPSTMGPVSPARSPVSTPDRFEPVDPTLRIAPADTLAGGGCLTPLVDPRDGARLVLMRSRVDDGDYAPPAGRYGVGDGELLRLRCNTGGVVGVVRR